MYIIVYWYWQFMLGDEDPFEKMYKYKDLSDLSNFSVSNKYYCSDNKKGLGKMKDEYGGKVSRVSRILWYTV